MKNKRRFFINEKVWDDNSAEWAIVVRPEERGRILLQAVEGDGMTWIANVNDVYQIAPGLRTICSGDIVCYEHNQTEDGYPYYCPELQENMFSFEVDCATLNRL